MILHNATFSKKFSWQREEEWKKGQRQKKEHSVTLTFQKVYSN